MSPCRKPLDGKPVWCGPSPVAGSPSSRPIAYEAFSEYSASLVSAYRPEACVLALSQNDHVLRRLALRWGVKPAKVGRWVTQIADAIDDLEHHLVDGGIAEPGDDVAVTFGRSDYISGPGRTNVLWLWRIRDAEQLSQ